MCTYIYTYAYTYTSYLSLCLVLSLSLSLSLPLSLCVLCVWCVCVRARADNNFCFWSEVCRWVRVPFLLDQEHHSLRDLFAADMRERASVLRYHLLLSSSSPLSPLPSLYLTVFRIYHIVFLSVSVFLSFCSLARSLLLSVTYAVLLVAQVIALHRVLCSGEVSVETPARVRSLMIVCVCAFAATPR